MNTLSTHSAERHNSPNHRAVELDATPSTNLHEVNPSTHHDNGKEKTVREKEAHSAHLEARHAAPHAEEFRTPREERSPAERRGPVTQKQLTREFNHTIHHIQDEMPPSQKAFSKFIHIPTIEKTSDILSITVARPNALLAGSVCAFALTLGVYLFAKSVGYTLSGFEPIAAFITGWLVGMLYDYLRIMITGKR